MIGAREYRCCNELTPVLVKLSFEGVDLKDLKCICQYEDFAPLTHRAVLLNVGPLLRGKDGKKYNRRGTTMQSENE